MTGRDDYGLAPHAGATIEGPVIGTVLFADIRSFTAVAERLSSSETAELLGAWFEHTGRPVLANGGTHVQFIGDGLMSLFLDDAAAPAAARRALAAGLGIALAAHEFRAWIDRRFAGRDLPPFAIGVGLHAGELSLCRFDAGEIVQATPIGDTVNVAARLESASKDLGWTVVASRAVLERAGAGVQTQGSASLALRGRHEPVEVAEVTGLLTTPDEQRLGLAPLDGRAVPLRTAVSVNSSLAGQAPDGSPVTIMTSASPPGETG